MTDESGGEAKTTVFVPKGATHAFKNAGTETARMMAMAVPAGLEDLLREVGQPAGEGAAPSISLEQIERMIALAPNYDTEIVPSPKDQAPISGGSSRI